jgi:hypothetical protein
MRASERFGFLERGQYLRRTFAVIPCAYPDPDLDPTQIIRVPGSRFHQKKNSITRNCMYTRKKFTEQSI